MDLTKLPQFASDLVALLDKAYPHKCVEPGDTLEAAHRYAGKRELVDHLIRLKEKADRNILQS